MTPLFKVTTCDTYPYRWVWDGKYFQDADTAKQHAEELSAHHWQVQIMGRAHNGKWVTVGNSIVNGYATVKLS